MTFPRFLVQALAAGFVLSRAAAAFPANVLIESPDHPSVWYNRSGDKESEGIEWNDRDQQLLAHVSYNSEASEHPRDQLFYDTFTVRFPQVRLDDSTGTLYITRSAGRTTIGTLRPGVFHRKAELNGDLHLSMHRKNGVLVAAIVRGPSDE